MKLFSANESGNSYKARLLASLLGLTVDLVDVNLGAGEQRSADYLAMNPRGEVPALVDGDQVFTDSAAILVYLASKSDQRGWWPEEAAEQAQIVQWLAFAASWVQFGVFTARAIVAFGGTYNGVGLAKSADTLAEARIRSEKSLKILETALAGQDWLANGRPTIADVAVFPYVALAPMGDVDLTPYANVRGWIDRIKALPGFVTMPGIDDPDYRRK